MSYSPMADDLLDMLPRLVIIEAFISAGTDGYTDPSYAAAKTYHAYIGEETTRITSASGEQIVSAGVAYLHPRATDTSVLTVLSDKARVTLPDGTRPRLLRVIALDDEVGATLWALYF